jgi:hypothetical protein
MKTLTTPQKMEAMLEALDLFCGLSISELDAYRLKHMSNSGESPTNIVLPLKNIEILGMRISFTSDRKSHTIGPREHMIHSKGEK